MTGRQEKRGEQRIDERDPKRERESQAQAQAQARPSKARSIEQGGRDGSERDS